MYLNTKTYEQSETLLGFREPSEVSDVKKLILQVNQKGETETAWVWVKVMGPKSQVWGE